MADVVIVDDTTMSVCVLNVYDLGRSSSSSHNNIAPWLISIFNDYSHGGGIFHCGLQVYDIEWSYGYNNDDADCATTGVYGLEPRSNSMHRYRESIPLGKTKKSPSEVSIIILSLMEKWIGADYHFIRKNCISFCVALASELQVNTLPKYITNLPDLIHHQLLPQQTDDSFLPQSQRDIVQSERLQED